MKLLAEKALPAGKFGLVVQHCTFEMERSSFSIRQATKNCSCKKHINFAYHCILYIVLL